MVISPHGEGSLVNRLLTGPELQTAQQQFESLPRVSVDAYTAFDIDGIAKGIFTPLEGFMNEEQTRRVMDTMYLAPTIPWTFPILLPVSQADADRLEVGQQVGLVDEQGQPVAILDLEEKFAIDKQELAEKIYRTTEDKHPGVAYTYQSGPVYLAGPIHALAHRRIEFQDFNLTPSQTREAFKLRGWKRIVAFQTRNPIHRAHEYLTKCALEICDGLMIHPIMGTTKKDDIPGEIRMRCYQVLMDKYYAPDHVMLSLLPVNMRYAGPREAILHAIMRRNFGCTHFIVGRDHAGVGDYYGTYDAHYIFDEFDPKHLGVTPMFFDHAFFSKITGSMASKKTCPGGPEDHIFLSGTKVRQMLKDGQLPPEEFTRPEVAKVLMEWARQQG